MSSLVDHAQRELVLSGQYEEDPKYSQSIVRAVAAFASYGHSGGSASVAIEQLHQLLQFRPLSPLTSDPDEWMDRSEESGYPLWQNKRDSAAFSEDGGQTWYYVDNRKPKPTIVVLCGSTRFKDAWYEQGKRLTYEGKIVLSVGDLDTSSEAREVNVPINPELKRMLDDLHKRKIDLADEVFILNVGGYIGESTLSEIQYAEDLGKPISYLEQMIK